MISRYFYLFLISFSFSFLFTPLIRYLSIRNNLISSPRQDRWHKKATAILGGAGIYLSFLFVFLLFKPIFNYQILGFLISGSLIFIWGFLDDIIHLNPQIKLLGQIIIACIAVYFGISPKFGNNPLFITILAIIWIVGITNSINLLDNMDGLASGITAIAFTFLFMSSVISGSNNIALISLIFMGACFGFLPYNFNPAKIFMGDCGSMFLGFSLASVSLMGETKHIHNLLATLIIPVLILAVPIFDTILVTFIRTMRGRSILEGGKDHTSHRLVSLGLSERKAVFLLYVVSIVFGLIALLYHKIDILIVSILTILTLVVLLFFGIFLAEIESHKDSKIENAKIKKIQEGKLVLNTLILHKRRIVEVFIDMILVCVAYYGAYLLRFEGKLINANFLLIKDSLPWIIIIRLLCFWYFRLYHGIWRYIGVYDLISIFKAVSLGSVFSILLLTFLFRFQEYSRVVFIIDWLLVIFLLAGIRILIRVLHEAFSNYGLGKKKILIIGAGDAGELVLREIKRNSNLNYNPIGFIDDNLSKLGRTIHGVPVLGTRTDIVSIVKKNEIEEIIIAIPSVSEENLKEIFEVCNSYNIPYRQMNGIINNNGQK